MAHSHHKSYPLRIWLRNKSLIVDLFQMTKTLTWQIRTFPHKFPLLRFHLFDTSDRLTIVYQQIQSCAD